MYTAATSYRHEPVHRGRGSVYGKYIHPIKAAYEIDVICFLIQCMLLDENGVSIIVLRMLMMLIVMVSNDGNRVMFVIIIYLWQSHYM